MQLEDVARYGGKAGGIWHLAVSCTLSVQCTVVGDPVSCSLLYFSMVARYGGQGWNLASCI